MGWLTRANEKLAQMEVALKAANGTSRTALTTRPVPRPAPEPEPTVINAAYRTTGEDWAAPPAIAYRDVRMVPMSADMLVATEAAIGKHLEWCGLEIARRSRAGGTVHDVQERIAHLQMSRAAVRAALKA